PGSDSEPDGALAARSRRKGGDFAAGVPEPRGRAGRAPDSDLDGHRYGPGRTGRRAPPPCPAAAPGPVSGRQEDGDAGTAARRGGPLARRLLRSRGTARGDAPVFALRMRAILARSLRRAGAGRVRPREG